MLVSRHTCGRHHRGNIPWHSSHVLSSSVPCGPQWHYSSRLCRWTRGGYCAAKIACYHTTNVEVTCVGSRRLGVGRSHHDAQCWSISSLNRIFAGYTLSSKTENANGFLARLSLTGPPCNAFGQDVVNLTLEVTYETKTR